MPREERAVDRHHPRHRHDGGDRSGDRAGAARRQDHCPDWRDGPLRVRQLGWAVQSRERGLVRAGTPGRSLLGHERSALRLGRGPEESRAWCVRVEACVIQLASRLPSVGTTIFTVMSRLAADVGAINLSQGFPDFDCDPELIEAVARHMRAGRNQYAPMPGVPALREAIARMYLTSYGRAYDPETEVTVTSGGTEAIFDAVAAVLHPGEEAIVLEPCYDSYIPAIELSGGIPRVVPLRYPDYNVDWPAVRAALTPKTRLLIINTPHNPAGAVLSPSDIQE